MDRLVLKPTTTREQRFRIIYVDNQPRTERYMVEIDAKNGETREVEGTHELEPAPLPNGVAEQHRVELAHDDEDDRSPDDEMLPVVPAVLSSPGRKVFSIADLHGDYVATVKALQLAGVLGEDQRSWTGGQNVVVQTGDVADRGDNAREIYQLFFHLQEEAEAVGGEVGAGVCCCWGDEVGGSKRGVGAEEMTT